MKLFVSYLERIKIKVLRDKNLLKNQWTRLNFLKNILTLVLKYLPNKKTNLRTKQQEIKE